MEENEYLTIEDNSGSEDVFDVIHLKEKAIAELQELTGKRWTDYNIHDPGITTLEILCFAITELAYSADSKIEDIFFTRSKEQSPTDTFFKSEDILTSGNVTISDLKRIILDISGIKNVQISRAQNLLEFKGVYDINVEPYNINLSSEGKKRIESDIREVIDLNRVLCTDLNEIRFFDRDKLSINLSMELSGKVNPSEFLRTVATAIEGYFSPNPAYQSLKELISEGVAVEEIFSGPLLKNGFITEENIKSFETKDQILVADLVNVLMDIDKVVHISKIKLVDADDEEHNWSYSVKNGMVPRLDLETSFLTVTYKGKESFSLKFDTLRTEKMHISNGISAAHKKNTLTSPKGAKRDFLNFRSIQHDFPKLYGVGENGLPVGASEATMGYTKQFKGYLSFFDQILANYFSQLNNLKSLFSIDHIESTTAIQMLEDSPGIYWLYKPFIDEYLAKNHSLEDVHLIQKDWKSYLEENRSAIEQEILEAVEDEQKFLDRRNRILDHLLARFGFDLTSFEFVSQLNTKELISHKIEILRSLATHGKNKTKGISQGKMGMQSLTERSGFEQYLYSLLGLRGGEAKKLTDVANGLFKKKRKASSKISFEFREENTSEILKKLFFLGSLKHNFAIEEGYLKLFDKEGHEFASSKKVVEGESAKIHNVFDKIERLNSQSEGFYLIEHLLLKPTHGMPVFGLSVPIDGDIVFESAYDFDRSHRDHFIASFCENCTSVDSFDVVEVELKQFKVVWKDGNTQLMGCYFFDSKKSAEEAIKKYVAYFREFKSIESELVRSTKYHDFYNEVTDPFSNIITYVFPDWPSRFQNNAFKKYIEDFILSETPAHVFANIIWLDFEEMSSFESQYDKWIKASKGSDLIRQQELDAFLPFLVKN